MFTIKNLFNKFFEYLLSISLGFMAILVFINVILRYVFNTGIAWTVELSTILFVAIVFIGSIEAFKDRIHIKVDILPNLLKGIPKKILLLIGNVVIFYALYIIFQGSMKLVEDNMIIKTPVMGIPQSYIYMLGIVVSVTMAILLFIETIKILLNKEKKQIEE